MGTGGEGEGKGHFLRVRGRCALWGACWVGTGEVKVKGRVTGRFAPRWHKGRGRGWSRLEGWSARAEGGCGGRRRGA